MAQYGSTEAIEEFVVLQFKVLPFRQHGKRALANASTDCAHWQSHLGSCRYLHPRLGPHPIHPPIGDQVFFPLDLLRGPRCQCSVRRRHHPQLLPYLPADFVQLGPFYIRWLLRQSEIAGIIHRNIQPAHGCDCGRAADARIMGFAKYVMCSVKIFLF